MIPGVEDRYNNVLEDLQEKHQLTNWLVRAHIDSTCKVKVKELVDQIDNESKSHMKHAERKSRKSSQDAFPSLRNPQRGSAAVKYIARS